MKWNFLIPLLTLGAVAFAATTQLNLVINGAALSDKAIVVDGRTYVPVTALKSLGVNATVKGSTLTLASSGAQGGANQVTALQGCMSQTFFNGIWRVKVTSINPIRLPDAGSPDIPGWAVNLEVRNGSNKSLSLMSAGFGSEPFTRFVLVQPDGKTLKVDENDVLEAWSKNVVPGGVMTFTLKFSHPRGTPLQGVPRPNKFLVLIDPKIPDYVGVKFTVPDPSVRVQLDCKS
ncbi:hypothetical protein [Deinococcus yavapaiensis]|uniref:DUF4352 domain-containing protein n=1 Tax=Deinococcus yavapaiensis KR-236 TaxID=694435 RepID=A0A318S540_9DEIO|nr:hypothetical protein [Deinococcus yavapaiensis]PYE50583.1 hypothetical protein DES52_117101 [Deinococcus yavapaiensis KR-236]